jgi:hypothetical protein
MYKEMTVFLAFVASMLLVVHLSGFVHGSSWEGPMTGGKKPLGHFTPSGSYMIDEHVLCGTGKHIPAESSVTKNYHIFMHEHSSYSGSSTPVEELEGIYNDVVQACKGIYELTVEAYLGKVQNACEELKNVASQGIQKKRGGPDAGDPDIDFTCKCAEDPNAKCEKSQAWTDECDAQDNFSRFEGVDVVIFTPAFVTSEGQPTIFKYYCDFFIAVSADGRYSIQCDGLQCNGIYLPPLP